MSDRLDTPGLIERATVLLAAARNVTGPLRPYYTAQARLAFEKAAAEIEVLRTNLASVESTLETKSDG